MEHNRRRLFTLVGVFLFTVSSVLLNARVADKPDLGKQIRLSDDSKLGNGWEVTEVTLDTKLVNTTGYLRVKNLTPSAQEGYFYGQYFDAKSRFCFSLLFSATKNLEGKAGGFASSEVRTLFSLTFLIAPASEPTTATLLWIPGPERTENSTNIQTPITVQIMTDTDGKVRLPSYEPQDMSVADLALASVIVDSSGHLQGAQVVHAIDPEVASWFSAFLVKQFFRPATINMTPITTSSLILLRFLATNANNPEHNTEALSPTSSRWIEDYAKAASGPLLPITSVVLIRPPTRVKLGRSNEWTILPPAPGGVFEPLAGSSAWCPDVATWP
jgi:hypothetical protein